MNCHLPNVDMMLPGHCAAAEIAPNCADGSYTFVFINIILEILAIVYTLTMRRVTKMSRDSNHRSGTEVARGALH